MSKNVWDSTDTVRLDGVILANGLRCAVYRVRDPETGDFGKRQFHMTYNNLVLAVMSEEAAKLFATFVTHQIDGTVSEDAA